MAERETVGLHVWTRCTDATVYARSETCLDAACDLARVIGSGVVLLIGDRPGECWRGEAYHAVAATKGSVL